MPVTYFIAAFYEFFCMMCITWAGHAWVPAWLHVSPRELQNELMKFGNNIVPLEAPHNYSSWFPSHQ